MAKTSSSTVDEWDYISCGSNVEPASPPSPLPEQQFHAGWRVTKTHCLKTEPRAKKIKIRFLRNHKTKKMEAWELTPLVQVHLSRKNQTI